MLLHNLALLLLLIVSPSAALIDCSRSNSCFGEPLNCDPDTDCRSLFHFDSQGNVELFLRHFKDSEQYAAFAVDRHPDDLIEYNICLPHQGQRLRALATLGEAITVIDKDSDGVVQKISENYFRCQFDTTPDLLRKFQQGQIQLSKGNFAQDLVIQNGARMYNVETSPSSSTPDEGFIPVTYPIAAASIGFQDDVYTSDDRQEVSDAMSRLPKASGKNKDDLEMEKLLRSAPRRREEEEDSEASEDEEEDVRRPNRRQNHKSKSSRPSRYDEDVEDEDVDMEQEEEDYRPRGKKNKRPTLRRQHDEDEDEDDFEDVDDEPKRRRNNNRRRQDEEDEEENEKPKRRNSSKKNKKDEDDDYESEDDDVYDDEDNATRCNFVLATLSLVILKFFF